MRNELNGIWKQVSDFSITRDLSELGFIKLSEAAKYVLNSFEEQYFFRRNRELIDMTYRFRCFQFQNKHYIIKVCKANEIPIEYYNALQIKEKLEKNVIDCIQIVCPVVIQSDENGIIGLLQEDNGYTLYENVEECRNQFSIKKIFQIYSVLLKIGIEWSGFLPRNLFFEGGKWYCIDFEDVYFHKNDNWSIRDLTIFKLLLGWGQVYEINQVRKELEIVLNAREITFAPLDSFEKALAELIDSKIDSCTRSFGFDITYESELPVNSSSMTHNYLSSMDIGHLVEDIFDNDYLSVWYTMSTSKMRIDYGDDYYAWFLNCFEHVLVVWLNESRTSFQEKKKIKQLQEIICCLLILFSEKQPEDLVCNLKDTISVSEIFAILETINPCVTSIKQFQQLQFVGGWSAALARSKCIHNFLKNIYLQLTKCFPLLSEYDLLLRGSCAQGLMTMKSDVDFEISSEQKPHGFIAAERLLSSILDIFNIECEGSPERPTEIDMKSMQGFTRDFHEWCELVIPGSKTQDKGWNNLLYNVDAIWQCYSEYESQKHNLSTKYLFFQIRAIIERYAIKYSITQSLISDILKELYDYLPNGEMIMLNETVQNCLKCYEANSIDIDKCISLKHTIDYLYAILGIKYHD